MLICAKTSPLAVLVSLMGSASTALRARPDSKEATGTADFGAASQFAVFKATPSRGGVADGAIGPNKACTAASPKPWARAKAATLARSGMGVSLVITLRSLPSGNSCRPTPGAMLSVVRAVSPCRSVFSMYPVRSSAKSPLIGPGSSPPSRLAGGAAAGATGGI